MLKLWKKFSQMRKNGFKKDLPALPPREFFHVYKQLFDEVFVTSRIIKVEVGVNSRSRRLRMITLTETLIILDITKTSSNNCFITHRTEKNGSHVFASSLMASNTKCTNLTWIPLEINCTVVIHDMISHDLECPQHDYCIICS